VKDMGEIALAFYELQPPGANADASMFKKIAPGAREVQEIFG